MAQGSGAGGIQLRVGPALPIRPEDAAKLTTPERGVLCRQLGLDPLQIAAAEDAVHAVIVGTYLRRAG